MSYYIETILINIRITLVVLLSFVLEKIGTVVLPLLSAKFYRKPFNRKPCLTFWLHGLGMSLIALIAHSWIIALSGVITAFVVFAIVWSMTVKE